MSSFELELPHAASLTEFGEFKGDCMWDAMLAGLHTLDPVTWPLALAVLNGIVVRAIAEHRTCPGTVNGCATMAAIGLALHDWYGIDPVFRLDYRNPLDWSTVHAALTHYGGRNPILLEIARGGMLPDNEPKVEFHGIAILAHTFASGLYGAANGDSTAAPAGVLSVYHWHYIQEAVPVALLVLPAPVAPTPPVAAPDTDIVTALSLLNVVSANVAKAVAVLQGEVHEQ